jgi:hypothetical protein
VLFLVEDADEGEQPAARRPRAETSTKHDPVLARALDGEDEAFVPVM